MSEAVQLYNFATGQLEEERIAGEKALRFSTSHWLGRFLVKRILKYRWITALIGNRNYRPQSKEAITPFIEEYGIDTTEIAASLESFHTFNEFFIRKLKPEARPFSSKPEDFISPADSRLSVYPIHSDRVYLVKDQPFSIKELLNSEAQAEQYAGGLCLIFRLAPVDYHRYIYFDQCIQSPIKSINGYYYSVNPLSIVRFPQVFSENYREKCILHTRNFDAVIQVEVGAMVVGRIVQHHHKGIRAMRGQEKGYFEFGGSTVILLFKPNVLSLDPAILEYSAKGIEVLLKQGQTIGSSLLTVVKNNTSVSQI